MNSTWSIPRPLSCGFRFCAAAPGRLLRGRTAGTGAAAGRSASFRARSRAPGALRPHSGNRSARSGSSWAATEKWSTDRPGSLQSTLGRRCRHRFRNQTGLKQKSGQFPGHLRPFPVFHFPAGNQDQVTDREVLLQQPETLPAQPSGPVPLDGEKTVFLSAYDPAPQ